MTRCECCDGQGYHKSDDFHYGVAEYYDVCECCQGEGETEQEVTQEDIDNCGNCRTYGHSWNS